MEKFSKNAVDRSDRSGMNKQRGPERGRGEEFWLMDDTEERKLEKVREDEIQSNTRGT